MKGAAKICAGLVLLAILFVTLNSCQNYRDLDHMVFVTSVLIDEGDNGEMVFYFETLTSVRNSSKDSNEEKRIVYKVESMDTGDALNLLEARTSSPFTLAHNKVLLFTPRFAEDNIELCFDLFDRRQEANSRTLLAVFLGETQDYIEPNHPDEHLTGLYLYDMLSRQDAFTSIGVRIDIKEFVNQKYVGDKVNSVPLINVSRDEETKGQYLLDGLGLIKEYRMIGMLDRETSFYFNLMLDNLVAGNIGVDSPWEPGKVISLLLVTNSFDSDVEYKDGVLTATRDFTLNTNLSAAQGKMEMTDENLKMVEEAMAEEIRQRCMAIFEEWKARKTDVFDIQEEFERKYPQMKEMNIIEFTELKLNVKVNILGTSSVKDTE